MAENKLNAQRFLSRLKNLHSSWTKGERRQRESASCCLPFLPLQNRHALVMHLIFPSPRVYCLQTQCPRRRGILREVCKQILRGVFKKTTGATNSKNHGPSVPWAVGPCVLYIIVPGGGDFLSDSYLVCLLQTSPRWFLSVRGK